MSSPALRARAKITSSACWRAAGKPAARFIVSVAQPSAPVGCSAGVENWLNGTASPYTSAPCTGLPLQITRKRSVIVGVERPTTPGLICCPSIRSRFGSAMFAIWIGAAPSHPLGGAGAARTTAVGTEVDGVAPSLFLAVTRTRIVLSTSTFFSTYVFSVAPPIVGAAAAVAVAAPPRVRERGRRGAGPRAVGGGQRLAFLGRARDRRRRLVRRRCLRLRRRRSRRGRRSPRAGAACPQRPAQVSSRWSHVLPFLG